MVVPDDGNGCMTVAHDEFWHHFPAIFLIPLSQVECLQLVGHREAVMGHYTAMNPIDWTAIQMPRLRTFKIKYSYLDEPLVGFLVNHSETLETVCLRCCFAWEKAQWRKLFERMTQKAPRQLAEFRVVAYPVSKHTAYRTREDWDELRANGCEEDEAEDEDNRRFVVAETCESYGEIQPKEWCEESDDEELDESDVIEE
jgi:hypothetical protein